MPDRYNRFVIKTTEKNHSYLHEIKKRRGFKNIDEALETCIYAYLTSGPQEREVDK